MYVLMELDHADVLGEFAHLDDAEEALDRVLQAEPGAAGDLGVVAFDDAGERVGDPITRVAA